MAPAGVVALVLALLSPRVCRAVRETIELEMNKTGEECPDSIKLEPSSNTQALQELFDAERESKGLIHRGFVKEEEPKQYVLEDGSEAWEGMKEKCSKVDVCLLMRQLDMEFYQRARIGNMVDEDFKTPPTLMPITTGNCFYEHNRIDKYITNDKSKLPLAQKPGQRPKHWAGQRLDKGFRMQDLPSRPECARLLGLELEKVEEVEREDRPRGCYYSRSPGSDKAPKKAYFNTKQTEVEAGIIETKDPSKGEYTQAKRWEYVQVCEMDRSLSQSAAAYYSPYKLKQNMFERPQMSTSCSFGMMSYLAKLKKTQSACAKLLATEEWEDSELKRTLMNVIANNWCPDIWTESIQGDRTCQARRSMSWARSGGSEEDTRAETLKDFETVMENSRPPKQALTKETCDWYLENSQDQTLASLL